MHSVIFKASILLVSVIAFAEGVGLSTQEPALLLVSSEFRQTLQANSGIVLQQVKQRDFEEVGTSIATPIPRRRRRVDISLGPKPIRAIKAAESKLSD
jgi:hypothetical protein